MSTLANTQFKGKTALGIPLFLILALLFFDYVRPQTGILPFLSLFRIPMLLIILLSLMGIKDKKWTFQDNVTRCFIVLLLICVFHVPIAVNNHYAYLMTKSLLIYFLTYMGIKSYVDDEIKFNKFLKFWLIIGVFCSIRGIFGGGKVPGSGFLGDENDFSLYLTMMLPIAYVYIIHAKSKKQILFNMLIIALLLLGVVSSFSRGGFIGLVGVSLYCFLITPKKKYFIIAIIFVFLIATPFVSTEYKDEISTIFEGGEESTAGERLYLWGVGLSMFYDNPIIGVGPGNFPWRVAEYEPPERYRGRGHGGRPAHSLYFTLIPELGFVGTACFVVMIVSPYRRFRNDLLIYKTTCRGGLNAEIISLYQAVYGVLFGFLFSGIFLSVLYYPHFWIVCGLLSGLQGLIVRKKTIF